MRKILILSAAAVLAMPGTTTAQSSTDQHDFSVIGTVPTLCTGGTIDGSGGTFDLGVLVDTTTGLLRNDLSAPAKVISGSFCSARSTINVTANAMEAQNFTATPPTGFSRMVNYVAAASGWTVTPASFDTGATANDAATQTRATAFTGDITVSLSDFATAGGTGLRLVADNNYQGTVTVTLTAAD